ncbi:MAG: dTDP-4-dehydrorhamnose reductase [Synergistaceae bacterium]|nr:dTDP-4-dehydrorhamnose reductase [Synergistaceae bacterium]MBQ3764153.1 dTDP-4-dehydrorhamnose reductase [Synergistaceae bacterium]
MSDKRIFITGANGQLGRDLVHEFTLRGIECVASDIQDKFSGEESCRYVKLDITDFDSVDRALNDTKPQRVIHCAAWTAVDAAEEEANRQKVYAVNVAGTENIAKACAKYDIIMTYISTDYIFDGTGTRPWQPDDDSYSPLNYYGETKLKGELAVKKYLKKFFIVRIAWVFGKNGNNFVRTMLKIAKTHDTLRVVNDQIGTPTYTPDLAKLLADINMTEKFGIYHATNEGGYISWYDFACEIFAQSGVSVNVIPVSTQEYGLSKAKRPYNSRLDKSKLVSSGFQPLPDWRDALRRYLSENGTD